MPEPPWTRKREGVDAVVESWLSSGRVKPCLAAERLLESTEGDSASFPDDLAPGLVSALKARGIGELYSHQRAAIDAARGGRHVVIATPTASGKSLCFHLPVLQALAKDSASRALYLYPTKALSRDQEHSVQTLAREAGLELPAAVYDGDTPGDARRNARELCRIVLTNPDMLHSGILPTHTRWAALFQQLEYVVLDELHTYRGVFGSHMAHVVQRLKRVARFHGSNPTFICATATIGNPLDHAARLLGVPPEEVELVDQTGAPQSARQVFLYNPPIVNPELRIRGSALKHAVSLAEELIRAKVPTLVFGQSRNTVEVMLKYLRDRASDVAGADAIMAYRGGYLPEARRSIERGLREGKILCVVATSALELGIDIGDLSAVICVGFPGSIAATWQRFGRAGRRGKTSIAVLVCASGSLDQYLAQNPDYLLESSSEEARIDPGNVEILIQHLKCAVYEAPFELQSPGDKPASPEPAVGESYGQLDTGSTRDALDYLAGHGLVTASGNQYHWSGDAFPASHVSLRNIGWDNFVIIDLGTGKDLAELDWRSTHTMLHEQAIYQHDAEQYQVERLDYENHKAFVRKVEPDYFTTALTYRTVSVIEDHDQRELGLLPAGWGEVKVVEKVTGYKKIKFFTHENTGYGDVHLPEMQMHTTSFWLTVPETRLLELKVPRATAIAALRGLGRALETVSTLALMCEPSDIGQTLGDGWGEGAGAPPPGRVPGERVGRFDPTLFLFDAQPGGVGLAARIFERGPELLARAHELITHCGCSSGCPACVGPSASEGSGKRLAALFVELWGGTDDDVPPRSSDPGPAH